QRKFKAADFDQARANYDLGVRDGKSAEELAALQQAVDEQRQQRDELTLRYQAAADQRLKHDAALAEMRRSNKELNEEISRLEAEYARLSTALDERRATFFTTQPPFLGKRWLELPILDAFNSPLKITNLWTDNLKIPNGSFGAVRRFDRCTTCHQ